jgi:hypothetical protein
MKFYFLKNLLTGSERIRNLTVTGILLTVLLLGCGTGGSDTFVQFEIEDQNYEVKGSVFVITRMVEGYGFYDLTYRPLNSIPGAIVQWRMKMEPLEKLVGRDLDLNTVDPNKVAPTILLRLTEDLTLQSQSDSKIHFKIGRIREEFIEGSFSGTDLKYVSRTKEKTGKVNITAQFRVKLIEKDWKDEVRSPKRSSK